MVGGAAAEASAAGEDLAVAVAALDLGAAAGPVDKEEAASGSVAMGWVAEGLVGAGSAAVCSLTMGLAAASLVAVGSVAMG